MPDLENSQVLESIRVIYIGCYVNDSSSTGWSGQYYDQDGNAAGNSLECYRATEMPKPTKSATTLSSPVSLVGYEDSSSSTGWFAKLYWENATVAGQRFEYDPFAKNLPEALPGEVVSELVSENP